MTNEHTTFQNLVQTEENAQTLLDFFEDIDLADYEGLEREMSQWQINLEVEPRELPMVREELREMVADDG